MPNGTQSVRLAAGRLVPLRVQVGRGLRAVDLVLGDRVRVQAGDTGRVIAVEQAHGGADPDVPIGYRCRGQRAGESLTSGSKLVATYGLPLCSSGSESGKSTNGFAA